MDLDKKLALFYRKLKELGFNTIVFNDGNEIICLEIPTKNFKATLWKEKGRLTLFIPFPSCIEKEIKYYLESDFLKVANDKIKELCSINDKLVGLNCKIKPWPLYSKYDTLGMRVNVNSLEDVINLLKKFDGIYEKANANL
jgi:hypothetical protein